MKNLKHRIFDILFIFFNVYALISLFIPKGEGTIWIALKYCNSIYIPYPEIRAKAIAELFFMSLGGALLILSLILLIFRKKCSISAPMLAFFIASVLKLSQYTNYPAQYLFTADYILIVFTITAVCIDIFRLYRYFKAHPRPPRPHKPTDKERIAELERRISELEGKD